MVVLSIGERFKYRREVREWEGGVGGIVPEMSKTKLEGKVLELISAFSEGQVMVELSERRRGGRGVLEKLLKRFLSGAEKRGKVNWKKYCICYE